MSVSWKLSARSGVDTLVVGAAVPLANLVSVWMLARHGEVGLWREGERQVVALAEVVVQVGQPGDEAGGAAE